MYAFPHTVTICAIVSNCISTYLYAVKFVRWHCENELIWFLWWARGEHNLWNVGV